MATNVSKELGLTGAGVEPLEIPEIEKAISKYQRKKEARCAVSPDELAAKNELKSVLHKHRSELPLDPEGNPFYRCDGRDYFLAEKLKIAKVDSGEDEED